MQTQTAQDTDGVARIEGLLASMGRHRRVLEKIMEFCRERRPVAGVNAWVEQLQGPLAVYGPPSLCRLLQEHGALERTVEEDAGEPRPDGGTEARADGAAEGGYATPGPRRTSYWTTTPAGCAYLEAKKAADAAEALIGEEPELWPVYEEILQLLSDGRGYTQQQVFEHLCEFEPYCAVREQVATAHLLDCACRAGAIEWSEGWKLTESGRRAIL